MCETVATSDFPTEIGICFALFEVCPMVLVVSSHPDSPRGEIALVLAVQIGALILGGVALLDTFSGWANLNSLRCRGLSLVRR